MRDIVISNSAAIADKIDALQIELAEIKSLLTSRDGGKLLQIFSDAKRARDAWLEKHGGSL